MTYRNIKRPSSRHIPKYKTEPLKWWSKCFLLILVVGFVGILSQDLEKLVILLILIAAYLIFVFIVGITREPLSVVLNQLKQERGQQNIGDFSAAFDLREVDPWVVRAVYEEFQAELDDCGVASFPLRSDDKIATLLPDVDDEDIEFIFHRVFHRTGRVCDGLVIPNDATLFDLVLLFNALPTINKVKQ